MEPSVLEAERDARRQLSRRVGDEDLSRTGERHDASRFVYGKAADIARHQLDLARVHCGAHIQELKSII